MLLRRVLLSCALSSLFGCLDVSTGSGSDTGGAGAGALDAGADAGPKGLGCGTDGVTGVTLCLGVDRCPAQIIDKDLWPGCGYRLGATGFDLQCVCDDELCPIGTPTRCEDVTTLLEEQSQLMVCAQRAEGRCVRPAGAVSSSSGGGSDEVPCDRNCAQTCGGDPGCLQWCGCAS